MSSNFVLKFLLFNYCHYRFFVFVFFSNYCLHPKGNQTRIFTGRTDNEAEAPILWPPDMKSRLIGKDPTAGKDWGEEE